MDYKKLADTLEENLNKLAREFNDYKEEATSILFHAGMREGKLSKSLEQAEKVVKSQEQIIKNMSKDRDKTHLTKSTLKDQILKLKKEIAIVEAMNNVAVDETKDQNKTRARMNKAKRELMGEKKEAK